MNRKLDKQKRKSRFSDIPVNPNEPGNDYSEQNGIFYSNKKAKSETTTGSPDNFIDQIKEATERARQIAEKINSQGSLEKSESNSTRTMTIEQEKQFSEQKELQAIYDTMMSKRRDIESFASKMKFNREYDSDEEIDENGTWEHKLRKAECEATKEWAIKLTEMSEDKHHIGDFLPPHELQKFMKTFEALKEGRTPDTSDYKDFKIKTENIGYKLLSKLGWKEGQGLGKDNQGIVDPINK